ncbi:MAG TPA: threonine synthase [Elusimicrobia bacterium]|nr:threonine synthase [Elusimicrobiota bacterium]
MRRVKTILGLRCIHCSREHAAEPDRYVCGSCGGNLQVEYDYALLRRKVTRKTLGSDPERSVWRYLDLLPVSGRNRPTVQVGWTPLYRARRLGAELGLRRLYLKDDGRNPSASFKDRAGIAALGRAFDLGKRVITGASTGNAASSLACLSAATGMKTIVFVPESAPQAKIVQLLVFGATVIAVRGTYDDAFDLCLKASAEYRWYNRNTGYNPYTREGKKTCAFELVEQLAWTVPDLVFVPVGDGNILSGVWKGFTDFHRLGLIDRLPRLVAVQAAGSDAIKRAFESDGTLRPVSGRTVADSISVSLPRDGEAAVKALRESGGFAVSVSDREILAAIPALARTESVFAEPAAAAAVAGLRKAAAAGQVRSEQRVVVLVTGNGLKDVASAQKAVGKPHFVEPELGALKRLVRKLKED